MKAANRALGLLLALAVSLSCAVPAWGAETFVTAGEKTAAYVKKTVTEPAVGSVGGEWAVLALCRGGFTNGPKASWYTGYLRRVEETLWQKDGVLSAAKYTEYSRVILSLTALGERAENAAGYDLLAYLADTDKVERQGINGAVWALIASRALGDCRLWDSDDGEKVDAVAHYRRSVLAAQMSGGGWAMNGKEPADPDLTAMALTALAGEAGTATAVERGLACLGRLQNGDGTFGTPATAESCAQVVICLSALGLDQSAMTKNGKTALDGLMGFARADGSFAHVAGGGCDQMATEQALCALAALGRQSRGESTLYDLSAGGERPAIRIPGRGGDVSFPDLAGLPREQRRAAEELAARGILRGRSDGTFDGGASMTRAEFCAVLSRSLGLTGSGGDTPFTDLPAWCAGQIAALYSAGIVRGTSATTFTPGGTITRQEAAVMLKRAACYAGQFRWSCTADFAGTVLAAYTDGGSCGAWAAPSVAFCLEEGLLSGPRLRPRSPITRGEIAQSVYALVTGDYVR